MITSSILSGTEKGVSAYVNIGGRTFFKNCTDTESAVAWLQKQYDDFGNILGFKRYQQTIEKGMQI